MNMTTLWKACEQGSLEDVKQFIENGADIHEKNEDGRTALCIAVELGRLDLVKYLVKKNANVNDLIKTMGRELNKSVLDSACRTRLIDMEIHNTSRGLLDCRRAYLEMTCLHLAALSGSFAIVKYFVEHGADVHHENNGKGTALHYAASSGSLEIVKYLVEHEADVNHENGWKRTALDCAVSSGSLEIVKYLFEHGADENHENSRKSDVLHFAVSSGSLDVVKYLVELSADVNHENFFKGTALHGAASSGSLEIFKYLVEHGADANEESPSKKRSLYYAAEGGSLEIVKYLVEHGADVNHESCSKGTALLGAASSGSSEIVKYLVEHGADVNHVHERKGTALLVAASSGSLEIVKCLVEHGADVNHEHKDKKTALHVAAEHGLLEIVKYLVEHGADVNHENYRKRTAIHMAASSGSLEIIKCLVQHGADVNYESKWKQTALHIAASRGSLQIVTYLVEHGADVNHEHNWKGTALHDAVSSGSLEIVKYLVEHSGDVNWKNGNNETPLHVALESGCFEIAKHLIEHGADGKNEAIYFKYALIRWVCAKGDKLFFDFLLRSENIKNVDKCSGYESSLLSIACSKGDTEIVRTLLKYNVNVRKESKLECGNDEIVSILELELKKSVKHREKIQNLRSMGDGNLTKENPPLRYFAAKPSLSIGVSSATVVYVGIMDDGSEVAVKRMFAQSCSETAENERKILELTETKKSPFIVNYRHFFRDDNFIYLISDLCEETLKELVDSQGVEYLQQHGPGMIKQILTGLEFLHGQRILHRDLKPSNVLVDLDGRMRLADFGISRVMNENETTEYTNPKGTTGWMATEVIEGIKQKATNEKVEGPYKRKSDVQVAGMIAFFILTKGKHPYGDPLDRMTNIVKGKPVYLKKLDSRPARQFVSWLISHKLEKRPYAHEALKHSFLDGIVIDVQRPEIVKI